MEAPAKQPLLVGRDEEQAALLAALSGPGGRTARTVLIEGEAGVGKTALLDAVLAARGTLGPVYRAGAEEMDGLRPYGLVTDAFGLSASGERRREDLAALLGRLPSGQADPDALLFRVTELLLDLVEEESERGPGLVVMEDVHWADPASLLVLYRLMRSLPGRGCSVVCTMRYLPRSDELERLVSSVDQRTTERLDLQPLTPERSDELVAALVGARPGPGLLAQARKAAGNPLYITELVSALDADGSIWTGPDGEADADADAQARAPSLAVTILRRLRSVTPDTVELLSLAAVLGDSFSVGALQAVSGRSALELWPRLQAGMRAGVLVAMGDRLRFRHQLVREAIYTDIPRPVRAALHQQAAQALGAAGAPSLQVAEHLILGAEFGDRQAVNWLRLAAEDAAPQAPGMAVELARHALSLVPATDPARAELEVVLALALVAAGRPAEGEVACRELLERGGVGDREGMLRFALARAVLAQGNLPAALEVVASAECSETLSAAERVRLTAWATQLPMFVGELRTAQVAAERAEQAALAIDDKPAIVQATVTQTHLAILAFRLNEASDLGRRAVELAEADGSREAIQALPHLVRAMALVDCDLPGEADNLVTRGRQAAQAFGSSAGLMFSHLVGAYGRFVTGRWDDASAELEAAFALAEETGTEGSRLAGLCMMALMKLWREGPEEAGAWVARAQDGRAVYEYRDAWLAWAAAACRQARGDSDGALEGLAAAWRRCRLAGLALEYRQIGPPLAGLATAAGEDDLAQEVAHELDRAAAKNPQVASVRAVARWTRGLVERDPAPVVDAVLAYRQGPRVVERAAAAADAAVLLARAGRGDEARPLAAESLRACGELGAVWQASRVRAELRRVGLRLGARELHRSATAGWEALTPTELKVVELVGERLSNPQIAERLLISRRTVESHVSHALAKLGVDGRGKLGDVVIRRQVRAVQDRREDPEQP